MGESDDWCKSDMALGQLPFPSHFLTFSLSHFLTFSLLTTMPSPYPISDLHIHIQPWRQLKPAVMEVMRKGKEDHWARLIHLMENPAALLELLDAAGIDRVGLINYPSPDLMGFDDSTNDFAAQYAAAAPRRLLPFGGVHPRFTRDPEGDVDRLIALGIRCLKIHPPHQLFPANAYTQGLEALGRIYRRAEDRGLPVLVHTGTSIFPGARSKYGQSRSSWTMWRSISPISAS